MAGGFGGRIALLRHPFYLGQGCRGTEQQDLDAAEGPGGPESHALMLQLPQCTSILNHVCECGVGGGEHVGVSGNDAVFREVDCASSAPLTLIRSISLQTSINVSTAADDNVLVGECGKSPGWQAGALCRGLGRGMPGGLEGGKRGEAIQDGPRRRNLFVRLASVASVARCNRQSGWNVSPARPASQQSR